MQRVAMVLAQEMNVSIVTNFFKIYLPDSYQSSDATNVTFFQRNDKVSSPMVHKTEKPPYQSKRIKIGLAFIYWSGIQPTSTALEQVGSQ